MAASAVLLDLDGTVWDGRRWYADAIAGLSGASAAEILARLDDGEVLVSVSRDCGVKDAHLARVARDEGGSMPLYEGVVETLDRLGAADTPIGVVSNLTGWLARPLLESTGIAAYLSATVTPRPGVPAKPSPQGVARALGDMGRGVGPDVWLVGDGPADAVAARAAGVRFAWARYGLHRTEPPGTDRVLARFGDALAL